MESNYEFRRRFLQITGSTLLLGLAGCTGNQENTPTQATEVAPTTEESPATQTRTQTEPDTPTTTTTESTTQRSLSVTAQTLTDRTVIIESASIDNDGWVVIHPEAEGGGPNGQVTLAQKQLATGEYTDIELTLTEPLSSDQTLYAMLHYDDPKDGEFTFPNSGDPPVTNNGNPVIKPFDVTVSTSDRQSQTVELVNTAFDPERIRIDPKTTIEWVNNDSYGHDVTSAQFHDIAANWEFSANLSGSGGTASYTFDTEGIHEYECTIHGRSSMCGVVLVGEVSLDESLPCEDSGSVY